MLLPPLVSPSVREAAFPLGIPGLAHERPYGPGSIPVYGLEAFVLSFLLLLDSRPFLLEYQIVVVARSKNNRIE